jgi:hypothetical protein
MLFAPLLLFLSLKFSLIITKLVVIAFYRCLNRYDIFLSSVIVRDRLVTFYKFLRDFFGKLVDRFMLLASICSRHIKLHVGSIELDSVAKQPQSRVSVECSIDSFVQF